MAKVLITGAAGTVGNVLRRGLVRPGRTITMTDRLPVAGDDSVLVTDLEDLESTVSVTRGIDTIVHLAGVPDEAPFEALSRGNLTVTYNIYEAARINAVRRVIYASSHHVIGMYERSRPVDADTRFAPDSLYAATKVFGEALGSVYSAKYGIQVVNVRIGSFQPRPRDSRQLQTWLSPADAVTLFDRAIDAGIEGEIVVYGVSANAGRWWSDQSAEALGYHPADDASKFAQEVDPEPYPTDRQGGVFTLPTYKGSAPQVDQT
jgi:uronate dehydrogenase